MTTASVTIAHSTNRRPFVVGASVAQSGCIIAAFRKIFSEDTRKTLAQFLGISLGAADKKLNGQRELSLDEFCALLRTEQGFQYLTAVMSDSQVKWWRVCVPLMEVAEVQAMQIAARRKLQRAIKGAVDADREITEAIARADALLVHDEDFARPHADAIRAVTRVPDRAMAASAGKGQRR